MKLCPNCKGAIVQQRLFQYNLSICYRCYAIGFTQTTLEAILKSKDFQGRLQLPKLKVSAPSCFACSAPTQVLQFKPGKDEREHKENLKVFQNWRYWFEHHRKGVVQIYRCLACGSSWMNARTFCRFHISWDELEILYRKYLQMEENQNIRISFDDPYRFVLGMLLGIPQLENTPSLSELPLLTYLVTICVGFCTSRGFKDPEVIKNYLFSPGLLSAEWIRLGSYAVIHESREQFFAAIIMFLVFSPMVEHELSGINYIIFLIATDIGAATIQTLLLPHDLTGLSGVVSGILTLFCLRFPSSVIGFGIVRFSAPIGLGLFLIFDLQSVLGSLQGNGNPAHLANLGGAFCGYVFHLLFPKGKVTAAVKKLAAERIQREQGIKNWNR